MDPARQPHLLLQQPPQPTPPPGTSGPTPPPRHNRCPRRTNGTSTKRSIFRTSSAATGRWQRSRKRTNFSGSEEDHRRQHHTEEDTDGVAPLGGSRMHSHRGRRDDNGDVSSDPEQRLRRFAGNLEKRFQYR
jgi:hypothetical protein